MTTRSFDVETAVAELKAAGWRPQTATTWRAPGGALFRGPADAWRRMNTCVELVARGEVKE